MTIGVTREEFTRQMDQLRTAFDERHKDTAGQIGELRRKGEERHSENIRRFEVLEKVPVKVEQMSEQLTTIGTRLAENTASTSRVEGNTATLIKLLEAATLLRRIVIGAGALAGALAVLWAVGLWIAGRGPFPPI